MDKNKITPLTNSLEHRIISETEMHEREQKQMQRILDVSVSCNYMRTALEEFAHLEEQRAKRWHWEHHLRCDGLPRPYLPTEIRTFLYRQRHFQNVLEDNTVDWTLLVDERSVLTQNIFRKNNTRRNLAVTMYDNIGERTERLVKLYLDTLKQIETMLGNQAEMARLTLEHQMEIMQTRSDIEQEIENCFDYLTYRVIRQDGVYMISTDAKIANWNYGCEFFKIDIWSLQDVSMRFDVLEIPAMMAELTSSGVRIQMPLSVLRDCLTLRCIWTKFDKISQNAKSFERIPLESVNLNAGIVDMEDSLINEWYMQLEIQQDMLDKIQKKWEQYEEIMEIIAEKLEKAAKDQKNARDKPIKHKHIPKPPKPPPQLSPGTLPDPYASFLEREETQYLDFLNDVYHPSKLNLTIDEINLRQYIMLGGVYSIMFVRRPKHKHFQKFNVTLHEDGRILCTLANITANLDEESKRSTRSLASVSDNRRSTSTSKGGELDRRQSNIQPRVNIDEEYSAFHLEDDELPYFNVTLNIPPDLCYWNEPVVCQYMACDQVPHESIISIVPEVETPTKKKHKHLPESPRSASRVPEQRFSIIQRRDTEPVNIFRPTLISILRQTKLFHQAETVVPFENFVLNDQLNSLKLRKLEQFLLPRILSSFKFPIDIKEEKDQLAEQRGKPQKGLLRLHDIETESNTQQPGIDFEFEPQQNPERVFPVFDEVGPVIFPEDVSSVDLAARNTSYGILNAIEKIKMKYLYRYRNISGQTEFEVKRSILKKKLDEKEKVVEKVPIKEKTPKKKGKKSNKAAANVIAKANVAPASITHSQSSYTEIDRPSVHSAASGRLLPEEPETEIEQEKPVTQVIHWTTKYIFDSKFDRETCTLTLKTDRLGHFGLAFKRYEQFPFRDWSLQPNEENPEEIVLRVDTFHVRVFLYISPRGVRGYVTDISKAFTTKPRKYLEIIEPISDFQELRQRFWEKNINIFAEHDASFYIDNGYFTIKHVAIEDHTYDAMALHCKLMKFYRSSWNRLATRRNILIGMKNARDTTEFSEVTIRITPDNATFVEVSEMCSTDLDSFKLEYKTTWRNINTFTDLHQVVSSMNPHANEVRNKDSMLLNLVKKMLTELRIISFS